MKYSYILIFILTLTASCKNDNGSPSQTSEESSLEVSNDPYIAHNQKLLQGSWRSLDEKGVTLTFKNNTRVENVEGKPKGRTRYFEIADECKNDALGNDRVIKSRAKYISLQDIDLCYYIINLDKTYLDIKVIGRGNTIRYKRMAGIRK